VRPGRSRAGRWNALLALEPANPFVRYEFLHALHASGCAAERTGWEPHHLTLWSGAELKAAAPLYRKHHSYGEYVFDWAWADAHQRHGVDYYPKWLVAVPFTPVPARACWPSTPRRAMPSRPRCSGTPRRPACRRCTRSSFPRLMPRDSTRWAR